MLFVIGTTSTAGIQMSSGKFIHDLLDGAMAGNMSQAVKGGLNLFFTLFILGATLMILGEAVIRWIRAWKVGSAAQDLRSQT
jgi:hypothetical protein